VDRVHTLLLSLRFMVHRVHKAMQQLLLLLSRGGTLASDELPVPTLQQLGGVARGFAASWGQEELNDGLKVCRVSIY
jgi:hypothetical protein